MCFQASRVVAAVSVVAGRGCGVGGVAVFQLLVLLRNAGCSTNVMSRHCGARGEFVAAMEQARTPNDRTTARPQAEAEFHSIVGWAVGQEWRPDGMGRRQGHGR